MLEHFNDYISITILILIILTFVYVLLNLILKTVERNKIKREMDAEDLRKEDK